MFCSQCGTENTDTSRFCYRCGAQLVQPAPESAVRRLSRLWIAIPITLLILVMLCGGLFLGLQSWLHLGTNEAAEFMPADSAMYMVFSPNLRQTFHLWRSQERFADVPGPPVPVSDEQAALFQSMGTDIDFTEDIRPWVGLEFGVAFLNAEETVRRQDPAAVFAIATRNQSKSDAFLQKLREQQELNGANFEQEEYRGIPVTYQLDWQGEAELSYATFNGFVVLTTDLKTMHQTIDLAQGRGQALARDENYKSMLAGLSGNRAGYVYLDWGQLTRALSEDLDLPGGRHPLGAARRVAASIGLTGDGIRFDYVLAYEPGQLTPAQRTGMEQPANPHKALNVAPGQTFAYLSGQNLQLVWDEIKELAGVKAQDLEEVRYELGIDLERDLFSWMTGEYAIALVPDPTGFFGDPDTPLNLLLLIEAEDRDLVERKMALVADALAYSSGDVFETQKIGGIQVQAMEDDYGEGFIGYGFVGDFLVIGTSRNTIEAAATARQSPLSDNTTFNKTCSPLPDKNNGYFYLDVEQATNIIYAAFSAYDREEFDRDVRPFLDPIKAVALATRQPVKGETGQGTLFIYLK